MILKAFMRFHRHERRWARFVSSVGISDGKTSFHGDCFTHWNASLARADCLYKCEAAILMAGASIRPSR